MSKKKLIWIGVLVIFVIAVVVIAIVAKPRDTSSDGELVSKSSSSSSSNTISTNSASSNTSSTSSTSTVVVGNSTSTSTVSSSTESTNSDLTYERVELDDGVLYSTTGELVESDVVIGDNYYDTTINDMYLNPDDYEGKLIEIEGMFLSNTPYTFVGRYSTASLCQYCATGYSYLEYEFYGDLEEELEDESTWIKLIGTWESATDSDGYDYSYLKVVNLEIMNESGVDTVTN